MRCLKLLLICAIIAGCGRGVQQLHPGVGGSIETATDVEGLFESQGFRLRRALDRTLSGSNYTCSTRYFVIQFTQADAYAALRVAMEADTIYERIAGWLHFHLMTPLNVTILPPEQHDMRYRANSRISGFSQSRTGSLYLLSDDAARLERFTYRLARLFLRRVVHERPVPWWFSTGMASYLTYQDQLNPVFKRHVIQRTRELELQDWNQLVRTDPQGRHPPEMIMGSLSVILFLADRYGEDPLRRFLGTYSRESYRFPFRDVFERFYKPQAALEREWRAYLASFAPPTGLQELEIEQVP